jgi:two-component system cell cycle response regulator
MQLETISTPCKNKCSYLKMLEEEIKNLRKENERLKKDHLTGVWNRHYLDEMLEKEYIPKIKKGWFYNVFMIDIDNLHNYNREKGYLEGDKYIKEIVSKLKNEIKKQNVSASIFRTGGDEFIIFVQPYDDLNLNNINNITFSKTIFDQTVTFKEVVDKLDKIIIEEKNKKKGNK